MNNTPQAFWRTDSVRVTFHHHAGAVTDIHAGHSLAWRRLANLVLAHITGYDAFIETEGGKAAAIRSGEVICIRPWVAHRVTTNNKDGVSRWSHSTFMVFGNVDVFTFYDPPSVIRGDRARRIGELNEELSLLAAAREDSWVRHLRQQSLGLELLALVLECSTPRSGADRIASQLGRLDPALDHINTHLAEAIYIHKVAALCGMSTSRFHAAFKESVGMAPGKFVQDLRLRKAQALLATSDQPVKAVAAAVGYPDEFHFSRLFSARFGRSPSEHRRQAREHRM